MSTRAISQPGSANGFIETTRANPHLLVDITSTSRAGSDLGEVVQMLDLGVGNADAQRDVSDAFGRALERS